MTDTPTFRIPVDPQEQPILESLERVRDELSLLKADRSTYIKSGDIMGLHDQLIQQVQALNDIRQRDEKPHEQNRVDVILDDCFQIISLAFMTVGRNKEAPAAYAFTSTMKRLLDHLKEAGFYYKKDLEDLKSRITALRLTIQENQDNQSATHSPHLVTLIGNRLDACEVILKELEAAIAPIAPELTSTYEKLVSILRSLAQCNARSHFPEHEVKSFQKQLQEMEKKLVNGKFVDANGTPIQGEEVVTALLKRCLGWADIVLERQGNIQAQFTETYEVLREIRNKLEKLSLTQAWSMRETDLFSFQRQLDRVDDMRVDGNFLDAEGKHADLYAQRTLLYLLRRSYAYIYGLLIASEPVSEALLPIYNQLQTLRKCLVEVKRSGGVSSPRELYPYSMKLMSIDNMRVDGKFMVGSDIPEGQGSVNDLLAECFERAYDLRVEAEQEEEEDEA